MAQEHTRGEAAIVRREGRRQLGRGREQSLQLVDLVRGILEQPIRDEAVLLVSQQRLVLVQLRLLRLHTLEQRPDRLGQRAVDARRPRLNLPALEEALRLGDRSRSLVLFHTRLLACRLHLLWRQLRGPGNQGLRSLDEFSHDLLHLADLGLHLPLQGDILPLGHGLLHLRRLLGGDVDAGLHRCELLGGNLRRRLGEPLGREALHGQESLRTADGRVRGRRRRLEVSDVLRGLLQGNLLDTAEERLLGGVELLHAGLGVLDSLVRLLDDSVHDDLLRSLLHRRDRRVELLLGLLQPCVQLIDLLLGDTLKALLVLQGPGGGLDGNLRFRGCRLRDLGRLLVGLRVVGLQTALQGLARLADLNDLLLDARDPGLGLLDGLLGRHARVHAGGDLLVLADLGLGRAEPRLVLNQLRAHLGGHLLALGLDLPCRHELPRGVQRLLRGLLRSRGLLGDCADVGR
mmetsp:Transcript_23034/g.66120  ORF Transcript_23034/g.66120 Transcript_23034/m.66120 type:complete len:460 (-) Transcript_23034:2215-3594(-)